MRHTQGFTLIELLIVIAILAAVLIPNVLNARKRGMEAVSRLYLKQVVQWVAMADTGGADPASLDGGRCTESLLQSEGAPAQYPQGVQLCSIVHDPSDNRYTITVTDVAGQSVSAVYWLRR